MKFYAVCDVSGRILRTGVCDEDMMMASARENDLVYECPPEVTTATHYRSAQGFAVRQAVAPVCPVTELRADGKDEVVFTLPAQTTVQITMESPDNKIEYFWPKNGHMAFSTTVKGPHTFFVDLFPYLNQQVVVHAR